MLDSRKELEFPSSDFFFPFIFACCLLMVPILFSAYLKEYSYWCLVVVCKVLVHRFSRATESSQKNLVCSCTNFWVLVQTWW